MPSASYQTLRRFIEALFVLSLGVTVVKLSGDRGGGDAFFTLLALVLCGTIAPYWLGLRAMSRWPGWAVAIGVGTTLFGAVDVAIRMQAFYFPTIRSDGAMALWLPLASLGLIPGAAVIAHTIVGAFTREAAQKHEGPA